MWKTLPCGTTRLRMGARTAMTSSASATATLPPTLSRKRERESEENGDACVIAALVASCVAVDSLPPSMESASAGSLSPSGERGGGGGVIAESHSCLCTPPLHREQPLRSFLNEDHDEHQHHDLGKHRP